MDDQALSVTFWGVRGSIPAPGPGTVHYGGETTCIEVNAGPHTVLVDCGSGARLAGPSLAARGITDLDVVFTHTHMDHICGLPFFNLAYNPAVALRFWGSHTDGQPELEEIIERLMSPPIFPIPASSLKNTHFGPFTAGTDLTLGCGLTVGTTPLHHPGRATGYKFEWAGATVAIITDHEHGNPEIDAGVAAFVSGASLMVYDAMYTEEEYPNHVGWGHSTPDKAVALGEAAGVGEVLLFHHDPRRDDATIAAADEALAKRGLKVRAARQGETLVVAPR